MSQVLGQDEQKNYDTTTNDFVDEFDHTLLGEEVGTAMAKIVLADPVDKENVPCPKLTNDNDGVKWLLQNCAAEGVQDNDNEDTTLSKAFFEAVLKSLSDMEGSQHVEQEEQVEQERREGQEGQ